MLFENRVLYRNGNEYPVLRVTESLHTEYYILYMNVSYLMIYDESALDIEAGFVGLKC